MIGCTDIVAKEINVEWAFMPTRFQAASGHRTRGQRVPTLLLLKYDAPTIAPQYEYVDFDLKYW